MGTPQTKDQRKKKGYTDDGWGSTKGQLRGIIVKSSRTLWRIGSHLGEFSRGALYPGHLLAQAEPRTSLLTSLLLGSDRRCESFRFPSLRRTAECVLNYIETVEKRYQAFDISHALSHDSNKLSNSTAGKLTTSASKKPTDIIAGLGRGVAPPLTPSSTVSPQKGKPSDRDRIGRREPSASFIPDARGLKIEQAAVLPGGPSMNGKGKGKEVDLVNGGQDTVASTSMRMSDRAEGDAERVRSLRRSLNGGRDEGVRGSPASGRNSNRDIGGSNGVTGRHAHFEQVQDDQDEAGEMQFEIVTKQESQIVDRQRSVSVRDHPPTRYVTDPRQTAQPRYSSRGPFVAPHQRRAPRASLPSRLGPLPSPSLSQSRAGSARERSASIVLPNLPAGTILRVNDRGVAEVLSAVEGQEVERDRERSYYEQDGHHQYSPRGYVNSGRGQATHVMKRDPDDEWFDGENLDEMEAEADEEYWQAQEEMEHADSTSGQVPPPAGHRWVLVPDDELYDGSVAGRPSVLRQQDRRYERPSVPPSRQADRQRVPPSQQEYRSGTGSRQGERGIPVDNWRASVQPTGLRYVTPMPEAQARNIGNRDSRRRHTEHVRPEQRLPLARPSVETNGQTLPPARRRQAYSLGGASDNGPSFRPTEDHESQTLDTHDQWEEETMDAAPLPDRRSAQVATKPAAKSLARQPVAQESITSRPYQPTEGDRSPLTRTVPMSAATASTQISLQTSSPSLKRYRPFSDHQVLRNPQNAKRARTSGLSTGRPEFQLAGASEDRRLADTATAAATRAERQKDIELLDRQRDAVAKQNNDMFMLESDDDE
jgi:hypothetical protein